MPLTKRSLFWLRAAGAAMAATALFLVIRRVQPGPLLEALRGAKPGYVLAAVVLYGFLFLPAAWRWQLALRLNGNATGFGAITRISLIGHFFYTIFFGAAGGDAAKSMLYARWYKLSLPEILAAASLDRLMGFGGLIVFAGTAFIVAAVHDGFSHLKSLSFHGPAWWLLLAVVLVIAGLLVALKRSPARSFWGRFVHTFKDNFRRAAASPKVFVPGLLCGLVVQIALSGVLALNLQAVTHEPVPWLKLFWTFPVISLISGLPVTVAGLGVRDSAAFVLLGLCGVIRADAVAASLLTAGVGLVWTVVGGLILWREAAQRKQKLFGGNLLSDDARRLAARKA